MLALIDNYDSFTYNLAQYFMELGEKIAIFRNDKISCRELFIEAFDALIISPGPCSPKEAGMSCEAIKMAGEKNIPVLGICLGFQSMGYIYGGDIIHAPHVMHGKTSNIYHNKRGIFRNIPSPFKATRYHSLILDPKSVPKCLEITAKTDDGIIMAVKHRTLPLYGVQFHPESILIYGS